MKDIAKSIKTRLLNVAKEQGENFNTLLAHYLLQRLLYRISISTHKDQFLLKGAWLFVIWNNALHRPTRDLDLLGFGANDEASLLTIFKTIATIKVEPDDGLIFMLDTFSAAQIKKDGDYQGVRIQGSATLDSAIIPLQVDIGFGDAVTPKALMATLPCLLDFPQPQLRVYPVYTAIAEKFQAMVHLGLLNSRIKDFYDIYIIASSQSINSKDMREAIEATFTRRNTPIVKDQIFVFSDVFKNNANKSKQWQAFIRKNNLTLQITFAQLIENIAKFIEPVYQEILSTTKNNMRWNTATWSWV